MSKDLNEYAFTFVYPPPQCLNEISEEQIIAKANKKSANVYVHIPYCTGKCTYCYFCRYDLKDAPVSKAEYIKLLCEEIRLVKEKIGSYDVSSIHIGEGTPTILAEDELSQLFSALRENLKVPSDIEITYKSSPETLNEGKLKFLRTRVQ